MQSRKKLESWNNLPIFIKVLCRRNNEDASYYDVLMVGKDVMYKHEEYKITATDNDVSMIMAVKKDGSDDEKYLYVYELD